MAWADRKLKLHEIADTLTISESSVFTIAENSERCFGLFRSNKKDFFMLYVTIDETRIHHYTPE